LYPSNKHDPYVTIKDSEDEDSEDEDEEIKPNDNLLLVGKVHGDQAVLQVYGKFISSISMQFYKTH